MLIVKVLYRLIICPILRNTSNIQIWNQIGQNSFIHNFYSNKKNPRVLALDYCRKFLPRKEGRNLSLTNLYPQTIINICLVQTNVLTNLKTTLIASLWIHAFRVCSHSATLTHTSSWNLFRDSKSSFLHPILKSYTARHKNSACILSV